ncbi:MAG TPA: hypothetical protein VGM91_10880, partial [Conexibacter sp.]
LFERFVIHRSAPEVVHAEMIASPSMWIEPIVRPEAVLSVDGDGWPDLRKEPVGAVGGKQRVSGLSLDLSVTVSRLD